MRNTVRRPGTIMVPLLICILLLLLVFVLAFPSLKEWWQARQEGGESSAKPKVPAELIGSDTLRLSHGVIESLDVRTVEVKQVTQGQILELSGSLSPNTDRLLPMRSRLAGEVVEIGEGPLRDPDSTSSYRPLTTGDKVSKNQLLAVVWSKDLGEKKSELVDAISRLSLDQDQYNRFLKAYIEKGAIPEQTLAEAKRSVETDRIAIDRVDRTLRIWRLTEEEITAIHKEAEQVMEQARKGERINDKEQARTWARVEVRAPFDGTILERNVAVGAIVDTTTNLFAIGDLSKLHLFAYAYEEDLPVLLNLKRPIPWKIRLKAEPQAQPLEGFVKEIRPFLDPTMHTALIRGEVNNPSGRMVSGQFITARIQLDAPVGEVEVPTEALIEDGQDSIVFVRDRKDKDVYTMRQVQVLRRTRDKIYIQSVPNAPRCQPLEAAEQVVVGGALELWSALNEQNAAVRAAKLSSNSKDRK